MATSQLRSASPFDVFTAIMGRRELVKQLAARDIAAKFRGSVLGVAWVVINPLIMLAVYSFVFRQVLAVRWGEGTTGTDFVLMLFTGLILFGFLSECLTRAPGVMLENTAFIKKVVFPLEVLPAVAVASAGVTFFVGLATLLVFRLALTGTIGWTTLFILPVFAPLALFGLGVSWLLASLGVFLRDLKQFMGGFALMLMFLSPIFFPLDAIPPDFQPIYLANPLTTLIEQARNVLIRDVPPDWSALSALTLGAWLFSWLALLWFRRTQRGFADVV